MPSPSNKYVFGLWRVVAFFIERRAFRRALVLPRRSLRQARVSAAWAERRP